MAGKESKSQAALIRARDGRTILCIGGTLYWDPKIFGVTAEDVMPMASKFVTYQGKTYFLNEAMAAHFVDDATCVTVEAEVHRRLGNV